jgi:hypothetical protein
VKRVADISTRKDIALEREREVLREWRWKRLRSKIRVAGAWILALLLALGVDPPSTRWLANWLTAWL